ncbi:ribonuclease HII [Magnetospira thiophila]
MPDLAFEQALAARFGAPVAGVDEVGRGPWAGPVVACAVILDPTRLPEGLDDSKKLTAKRRDALFEPILATAQVGLGAATVEEIDALNILQATFLAMCRAVAALPEVPAATLIDGNRIPPALPCPAEAVVGGDGRSLSIAAASIIAKVTRDRLMTQLDADWPGYGWAANAGYGTKAHQAGLARLGLTPHHRRSFAPIRKMLSPGES